jgi:hypothetical protein
LFLLHILNSVESRNKAMKQALMKYVNELVVEQRLRLGLSATDAAPLVPWGLLLPYVVAMKNSTHHRTLETTPFQMEFGGARMPPWIAFTPDDSARMFKFQRIMNEIAAHDGSILEDDWDDYDENTATPTSAILVLA